MKQFATEVTKLLTAFRPGEYSYPSVFDPKFAPDWTTHLQDNVQKLGSSDPKQAEVGALYLILGFMGKMRRARKKLFLRTAPPSVQKMVPENVFLSLLNLQLQGIVGRLWKSIQGTDVHEYLRVTRAQVKCDKQKGGYLITVSNLMEPKRKGQGLDDILKNLQSYLYNINIPPALRQKYQPLGSKSRAKPRSLLPKSDTLMKQSNLDGWASIDSGDNFRLYAARSRDDRLVMRYTLDLPNIFEFKKVPEMKTLLIKMWKAAFQKL